jgi:hypothetical protein
LHAFSQLRLRQLHLHCGYHRYELQTELAHKTFGIYAEVLFGQGTEKSSYSLVIPTKPDVGTVNAFGVRVFKYLNNVSVWWHTLGTTTLAIAILAAAPKH